MLYNQVSSEADFLKWPHILYFAQIWSFTQQSNNQFFFFFFLAAISDSLNLGSIQSYAYDIYLYHVENILL